MYMSQVVKKLQKGGSLTIDGVRYDATPELIGQLSQYLNSYGNISAPIGGIIRDLQSGKDVIYSSVDNSITGLTQENSGVDQDTFNKRLSTNKRTRLDNLLNRDNVQYDKAVNLLRGFAYVDPSKVKPKSEDSAKKRVISGDQTWYAYGDPDSSGRRTLLEESPTNMLIAKRLSDFQEYLGSNDEGKKGWDVSAYSPEDLEAINILHSNNKLKGILEGISERAKTNSLTAADLDILKSFHIIGNGDSSRVKTWNDAERAKLKNAGYDDAVINHLAGRATIDENGMLQMTDEDDWGLGQYANRNIYFNDDFYKYTLPGKSGKLNPFKNYTLYNGKLYNRAKIADILNMNNGYNQLMKEGKFKEANDLIKTWFADDNLENPERISQDVYSELLSRPGYRFSHITGLQGLTDAAKQRLGLTDEDLEDYQLVQYLNLDDPNVPNDDNPYTTYDYRFGLFDKSGKHVHELTLNDLQKIRDGIAPKEFIGGKRVNAGNLKEYRNMIRRDLYDRHGNYEGFTMYQGINDPNNIILHMPSISADIADEQNIKIPKHIAAQLLPILSNQKIMNEILGNADKKKQFIELISHLVQKGVARGSVLGLSLAGLGIVGEANKQGTSVSGLLQNWGIDATASENLWNAIKAYGESADADIRRNELLVPELVESEENGGVMKHQFGGVAGGNTDSIAVSQQFVNSDYVNPKNAAKIGDSKSWTHADDLDVAALVGDIASAGLAFVPGANIASAAAGFASSTARYSADKERKDSGALGNYLLNLGMDAATLIPFLGGVAKGAKVVRAVKRFLPTIIKAATVYGLGDAVIMSAKKIANNEGWTVRDVSRVVNAFTAGVGVAKSGKNPLKRAPKETQPITITGKNSGKKLTLSADEVKNIKNPEELEIAFFNKAKSENPSLTKEQFTQDFDIAALNEIKTKRKFGEFSWNPKKWTKPEATFEPTMKRNPKDVDASWDEFMLGKNPKTHKQTTTITHTPVMGRFKPVSFKFNGKTIQFTPDEVAVLRNSKNVGTVDEINILKSKLGNSATAKDISALRLRFSKQKTPHEWTEMINDIVITGPNYDPSIHFNKTQKVTVNKPKFNRARIITKERTFQTPTLGLALPQWISHEEIHAKDVPPAGVALMPQYQKGGIVKAELGLNLSLPKVNLPKLNFGKVDMLEIANTANSTPRINYTKNKTLFPESRPITKTDAVKALGLDLSLATRRKPVISYNLDETLWRNNRPFIGVGSKVMNKSYLDNAPSITPKPASRPITIFDEKTGAIKDPMKYAKEVLGSDIYQWSDTTKNHFGLDENGNSIRTGATVPEFEKEKNYTNLFNFANYLKTKADVKKTLDNLSRILAYTMPAFNPSNPRFVSSGVGKAYQDAATKVGFAKQATSDARLNLADKFQRDKTAIDYQVKGTALDSQEWSKYLNDLADFKYKTEAKNYDIASQNKYSWNNNLWKIAQVENAGISEISKHRNNLIYSLIRKYNQEYNDRNRIAAAKWDTDVLGARRSQILNQIDSLNRQFGSDTDNPVYKQKLANYQRALQTLNLQSPAYAYTQYVKKGGKITKKSEGKSSKVTYSRDPYPDLLLQEAKNTDKKVAQLNDAIIKLLLQTKPIHVS